MPVEKVSEGKWRVRLRYGQGLRGRFIILAKSKPAAEARAARMTKMANDLAACGKHAEAKAVLDEAGAAQSEKDLLEIEAVVRELCAESPVQQVADPSLSERTPFRAVAELWLSGELHRRWPDDVPAKAAASTSQDRGHLAVINTVLGSMPIGKITLDDAERAKALPKGRSTRRRYALMIRRVMALAEYPLRLIERSPIPPKFVPSEGKLRAFGFLYPSEDALLMRCAGVPYDDRIFYGFVDRNGLRVSEAARMVWGDLDLERGTVTLDKNKTKSPRSWALSQDVVKALSAYRGGAGPDDLVFPMFVPQHVAARFRAHLALAGVTRRDLHAKTSERRPIRFHDLRATFITLALASGRNETWVMDRTGHTTSAQLNRYRRQARHAAELSLGWLSPLDEALGVGHTVGHVEEILDEIGAIQNPSRNRTGPSDSAQPPEIAVPKTSRVSGDPGGPTEFGGVGQDSTVEVALAAALEAATKAQRWDVVLEVTRELSERRRARLAPDVPSLDAARKRRDEGGGK